MLVDQPLEGLLLVAIERLHTGAVVESIRPALWTVGLDETVTRLTDIAGTDFPPQVDQAVLARALVHQEKHIDPVQCLDRLHRDVVRVAGTNADHQELLHVRGSSTGAPLSIRRRRQRPLKRSSVADKGSTSIIWKALGEHCST
ncbi:hypothetical protein D3C81_1725920 [compost metagenome]